MRSHLHENQYRWRWDWTCNAWKSQKDEDYERSLAVMGDEPRRHMNKVIAWMKELVVICEKDVSTPRKDGRAFEVFKKVQALMEAEREEKNDVPPWMHDGEKGWLIDLLDLEAEWEAGHRGLCDYCSEREATYRFKNGKRCCTRHPTQCPAQRELHRQVATKTPWDDPYYKSHRTKVDKSLKYLGRLSLQRQCEKAGIPFYTLLVPRKSLEPTVKLSRKERIHRQVVKHFEKEGYRCNYYTFMDIQRVIQAACLDVLLDENPLCYRTSEDPAGLPFGIEEGIDRWSDLVGPWQYYREPIRVNLYQCSEGMKDGFGPETLSSSRQERLVDAVRRATRETVIGNLARIRYVIDLFSRLEGYSDYELKTEEGLLILYEMLGKEALTKIMEYLFHLPPFGYDYGDRHYTPPQWPSLSLYLPEEKQLKFVVVRQSAKFSTEQLEPLILIRDIPNVNMSVLRAEEEEALEIPWFVSQESVEIFDAIKKVYPSIVTDKDEEKKELLKIEGWRGGGDALIPELRIFLEYDGSYWHRGCEETDSNKTTVAELAGYRVVRIRQTPLEKITENDVVVPTKFDCEAYTPLILKQIDKVAKDFEADYSMWR